MSLKIAGWIGLLSACMAGSLAGQTAGRVAAGVTGSIRVAPLQMEAAQAQAYRIQGEGMTDDVMPLSCVVFVTALSIEKNVVTVHGENHLAPSQQVRITNLNQARYLNGQTLTVISAEPDRFTASFPHADVALIHDGGTAQRMDCPAKEGFRSEQRVEVFHDNLNYFRRHLSSDLSLFSYDTFFPLEQDAHYDFLVFNQPSYSWGNHGGWGVVKNHFDELIFNSRGIAQAHNLWCTKHATGDMACGDYIYGSTDGGSTAQSDEGFTVDTREGGETDSYFHGTAGAGASRGATVLPVVFGSGQDATTDGAFLLDISKGRVAGTVVGPDAIVEGMSVHTLPVKVSGGAGLSPSTGIGIIKTPLPVVIHANVPETITLDVALTKGSFKAGTACLAGGWYPEQVKVTAVSAPKGATQQVTVIHKNPNPTAATDPKNPSSLWQGGLCGNYLSLDRNLARDGFRTSYPVVGATDESHLAYVWNVNGSVRPNGLQLYTPPTPLTKLERKNGVVTANFAKGNSPFLYNRAPSVVIAEASDPSFNGTVATPVYTDGVNRSLSWKQIGPDATAKSATIDLPPESYGFHLYPGAEVLGPRTPQGVPLEPNDVAWEPGDTIENPHNPSFLMRFRMNQVTQHTLPSGADSSAELWGFHGAGISANFRPSRWINENPCQLYVGCGGTLLPITWTIHRGPYGILHQIDSAPMNGGVLFRVGCSSLGCNNPAPYSLFELQNGRITYDPATSTVSTVAFQAQTITARTLNVSEVRVNGVPLAGAGGGAPSGADVVNLTVGAANRGGQVRCANGYRCTTSRGRVSIVAARGAAPGKIARVNGKVGAGEICTATQNGGTAFYGIGSGGESPSGFDITSGVAITGEIVVDYFCRE